MGIMKMTMIRRETARKSLYSISRIYCVSSLAPKNRYYWNMNPS